MEGIGHTYQKPDMDHEAHYLIKQSLKLMTHHHMVGVDVVIVLALEKNSCMVNWSGHSVHKNCVSTQTTSLVF